MVRYMARVGGRVVAIGDAPSVADAEKALEFYRSHHATCKWCIVDHATLTTVSCN